MPLHEAHMLASAVQWPLLLVQRTMHMLTAVANMSTLRKQGCAGGAGGAD